jgi:superfamily II DNA or RNA helicase
MSILKIYIRASDFVLTPYKRGQSRALERLLTSFEEIMPNEKLKEASKKEFFRYDGSKNTMHIPQCTGLGMIIKCLNDDRIDHTVVSGRLGLIEPKAAHRLTMKEGFAPRDETQRDGIDFILSRGKFANDKIKGQKLVEMATGKGKTFTAIAVACELQERVIVVCPFGKVSKQWYDSFLDFTDLPKKRIKYIEGTQNLMYYGLKKKGKIDVMIISMATISKMAKENPELLKQIMENVGPGMIVRDEVHRNIMGVVALETVLTSRLNVYMSATAFRDSSFENKVFEIIFGKMPRFGIETHFDSPFLNVLALMREIKLTKKEEKKTLSFGKFFRKDGYSAILRTEKRIEAYKELVFGIIDPIMKILPDDRKVSMFLARQDEIDDMLELMKDRYPGKTVGRYHSKVKDDEKARTLDGNLIITTAGSLGTGSDVKGLKYQIDFYPSKGKGEMIQRAGRTREIKGEEVYMILVYNTAIKYYEKAIGMNQEALFGRIKTYTEK